MKSEEKTEKHRTLYPRTMGQLTIKGVTKV